MSDSDRSDERPNLGAFGALVALVVCCLIVAILAYSAGRDTERRDKSPASYSQAAKTDAQRACAGMQGSTAFECIYEKAEASQDQARGEQDLTAQQRAASSALASALLAFLTLILSGVGVWYVKRTLDATLKAVEDTGLATQAMHRQNEISESIGYYQLRPFMIARGFEHSVVNDGVEQQLRILINWINAGNTPSLGTTFSIESLVTQSPIWGAVEPILPKSLRGETVVGPNLAKSSNPVYFSLNDIRACFDGISHLYVFARVAYGNDIKKDVRSETRILWKFSVSIVGDRKNFNDLNQIAEIRYIETPHYSGMT